MNIIEIIKAESNIFGYSSSIHDEDAFDYFGAFFNEDQLIHMKSWILEKNIYEFVVIRNIYIDESNRGQGLGKLLTNKFILQANGNPVFLIASPDESDFNLISWYEKLGFQLTPFLCSDGPLMIKYP